MNRKIDITNWKTDEVIFSYTCENNTVKKTVEEAIKQGISLAYANLIGADLAVLNLSYANLNNANLLYANLRNTDLSYVNLQKSHLSYCNLSNANLLGADLTGVFGFNEAKLNNTILDNIKGLNNQCPKEGSFIGWKKCCYFTPYFNYDPYIVKLEIPADAKRSSCTGIKCRCDKAKVLEIQNLDGTKADIDEVQSRYNLSFKYKIGKVIEVPDFDERYWIECAPGIHFFIDKEDAIKY